MDSRVRAPQGDGKELDVWTRYLLGVSEPLITTPDTGAGQPGWTGRPGAWTHLGPLSLDPEPALRTWGQAPDSPWSEVGAETPSHGGSSPAGHRVPISGRCRRGR